MDIGAAGAVAHLQHVAYAHAVNVMSTSLVQGCAYSITCT